MEITGTFFFDPDDLIYKDHFPGNPVVPGTQIIRAFVEAGRRSGIDSAGYAIDNFRFKRFIVPGEYPFRIKCTPEFLACELYDGSFTVATGRLRI